MVYRVRLVVDWQRNEVPRDRSGNVGGFLRGSAQIEKALLDLFCSGEAEAVAVEPLAATQRRAREDPDIVSKRFYTAEAQALVADPFADLLVARADVADRVEVRAGEGAAAIGDQQLAIALSADQQSYSYLAVRGITGRMRIMSVLHQLEENAISVLGADHIVEALEALINL